MGNLQYRKVTREVEDTSFTCGVPSIDEKYQHNRIGTATIQTIIKNVKLLAANWPVRVITIDARENLVTWYEKLGFRKMLYNTPGQDGVTVSMFLDCMQQKDEFMEYIDSIYE